MLSAGFTLWMVVLTVAYYAAPSAHTAVWITIGVSSAGAVVVGLLVHRPSRRAPWVLVGASLLVFCAGDTTYNVLTGVLGQENPFPSIADLFYLAMYPLLAAGLVGFIRAQTGGRDRGSLLDAAMLTVGLALLVWIFLIEPYVRDTGLTFLEKATSVAYPLGDVLTIATLARLLTASRRRWAAVILLAVGTTGLLVADVLYGLIQLNGSWEIGGPVDLGWVLVYTAWGAAALHPSMVRMTERSVVATHEVGNRRLVLLGGACLIAPVMLLIESLLGTVRDASMIAILCGTMILLVLFRLAGMMRTHRHAVGRERSLREAGAALVWAAEVGTVTTAVRQAVAGLLPRDTRHVVLVQPGLADGSAHDRTAADLVRRDDLLPAARVGLQDFTMALRCPLALRASVAGGPAASVLYVGADEPTLYLLKDSLEVLASQAALALDRIALTDEVNRRNSEAYFRTLVHNTSDVIVILDDSDRIRYASPSAAAVFGTETLAGVPIADLVDPVERPRMAELAFQLRDTSTPHIRMDFRARHSDGRDLLVEIDGRDLRADHTVGGLVLTVRDVTAPRTLERELAHQAFHDSLTGLANRVLFADRVSHAVSRIQRSHALVGVLFIDLDDFKVINDTLGHGTGDQLLAAVADRIVASLRADDTAARLGGDEFAVLIDDAPTIEMLEQAADRIVAALAAPFTIDGEIVSGAASIGIAATANPVAADDLLRQADLALYAAKGAGKGQWRRYQSDLHEAVVRRLELRTALDQAVHEGQFTLEYQPIVDLTTDETVALEALIRWQHPVRGTIGPAEFIDVAEESGLIVAMGRWVLREALAATGRWMARLPHDRLRYVSVNVSARQVRCPGFVDEVRRALEATDVDPGMLMLEITESLVLRDDDGVQTTLAGLRQLGVRIAIDDFGTGYSSLSYLRHMPVDALKIDKSFIDDMVHSKQQRALVGAIVQLAETLDLRVVAEGVEEDTHRALLTEMGCAYGQGYLFARPLIESEAFKVLATTPVAA
jgi:diguanylate cyclase (GGDEF)-like protein/PAS domain S-box-containing protein